MIAINFNNRADQARLFGKTDLHAPVSVQPVSAREVETVLRNSYGLTPEGQSRRLSSYWDYNFRIRTNQGPLFCKVYTHDSHQDALFHADIIEKLHSEGLPTARVISTTGGSSVSSVSGLALVVQHFLPGKCLSELPLTIETVRTIGETLAQLHNVLEGRLFRGNQTKVSSWDPRQHDLLFARCEGERNKFSKRERLNLEQLQAQTDKLYNELLDLSCGIIHGDFHPGNILFNHGKISGIIDFNEAIRSWHIADIGIALSYLVGTNRGGIKIACHFIEAYVKERNLSATELYVLPVMMQLRAATKLIESRILDGSKSPEDLKMLEFFNNHKNSWEWYAAIRKSIA